MEVEPCSKIDKMIVFKIYDSTHIGGAISASSMATMPTDQISHRFVYPSGPIFISTAMISGAILERNHLFIKV
jgi:hypothetical protein